MCILGTVGKSRSSSAALVRNGTVRQKAVIMQISPEQKKSKNCFPTEDRSTSACDTPNGSWASSTGMLGVSRLHPNPQNHTRSLYCKITSPSDHQEPVQQLVQTSVQPVIKLHHATCLTAVSPYLFKGPLSGGEHGREVSSKIKHNFSVIK